ncbi:MAG TPA: hypothetical protein VLG13_00695 [Patescibacteria group bacterium]|nr:hypothetical protein [Patescibacteria group bacterium]
MVKKIKLFIAASLLTLNFGLIGFAVTHAENLHGDACAGLNTLDSTNSSTSSNTTCSNSGESSIKHLVSTVVNILSLIVGIASVIVIIIAGLNFITAGGDSNKVASARSTLIYALVGLVIAASAQFLVHFALNNTASATVCPNDPSKTVAEGC